MKTKRNDKLNGWIDFNKIEWKPCYGFPDYAISEVGEIIRIRLLCTKEKSTCLGRVIKPFEDKFGYSRVTLFKDSNKIKKSVHTLVLSSFFGPPLQGTECRHLDGNPSNNNIKNLKWGTHSENLYDRVRHGTHTRGDKNASSKLKPSEVLIIKDLLKLTNKSQTQIAKLFKVDHVTISAINTGKTWNYCKSTKPIRSRFHLSTGSNNSGSVLKQEDISDIKMLRWHATWSCKEIAKHYKVNTGTIRAIFYGKSWKWLSSNIEDPKKAVTA